MPITRPAVPSPRLADESVTLGEAQEKYQKISPTRAAFSQAGGGAHDGKETTESPVLGGGDNQAAPEH